MEHNSLRTEVNLLHAQVCRGLADPKRILILYFLADGPRRVTDLAETLHLPQPTVSHHLRILRERGLVQSQRRGVEVYYALTDHRIIEALDLLRAVLADLLSRQADLADQAALPQGR